MSKQTKSITDSTSPETLVDHNLAPAGKDAGILYDLRPALGADGAPVDGLFNAWITLDNPTQLNALTTDMMRGAILALKQASNARDVVCIVLTGSGTTGFCTGGDVTQLARYYAGNPQEFRQYMRLFMDMVTTILSVDKPTICRVNGMRLGGGQEIGLACDFTIAQDMARFGQAGPKHGSAPIAGATDFLPVMIGVENAMAQGILCQPISAHKAYRLGMITDMVPALKVNGEFIPNPLVVTDRAVDDTGHFVLGEPKAGDALKAGKKMLGEGEMDLSLLDKRVDELCTSLMLTFPECTLKAIEELRKPKLKPWNENKEGSRAWMALNMMNEGRAGFRAFDEGSRESGREVDFIALRQALAKGTPWSEDLIDSLMPGKD